jgi:hypothetical protein
VAQVAVAAAAADLGAHHAVADIAQVRMWSGSKGWLKLGQPVPDSNLLSDRNRGRPHSRQAKTPGAFFLEQAAAERRLRALVEDDAAFLGAETRRQAAFSASPRGVRSWPEAERAGAPEVSFTSSRQGRRRRLRYR